MVKPLLTSAFAVAALLGGTVVVVACSDSNDSTFPSDPPKADAEPDAPGPLLPDGGSGDSGEGGATSCTPAIPATFAATWKPETRSAAACTADELTGYYTACLANASKTETDGTCAKFKADHATCGACAEPTDNAGPIQWQLGRKFYTLNVAGCIGLQQDGTDAGTSGCAEAYNAAVECTRQSCFSCITAANSFALFTTCETQAAKTGLCASLETAEASKCTGYKATGSPAVQCFPLAGEDDQAFKTRVVGLTCGP